MLEALIFLAGGFIGVYCYNHFKWYKRLVDGNNEE